MWIKSSGHHSYYRFLVYAISERMVLLLREDGTVWEQAEEMPIPG